MCTFTLLCTTVPTTITEYLYDVPVLSYVPLYVRYFFSHTKSKHAQNMCWASTGASWYDSLPSFASAENMPVAWRRYLKRVYGPTVSNLPFPFHIKKLNFFFVSDLPASVKPCDRKLLGLPHANSSKILPGDALVPVPHDQMRGRYRYPGRMYHDVYSLYPNESHEEETAWVYLWPSSSHSDDVHGFPSNSWVEVYHRFEDLEDYWMYLAAGSGIYYQLGRTVVARDAQSLISKVDGLGRNVTGRSQPISTLRIGRCWGLHKCPSSSELMHQWYKLRQAAIQTLVRLGYESIQLTHVQEHGIFKFEIIDLRQHEATTRECYSRDKRRASAHHFCKPRVKRALTKKEWQYGKSSACPTLSTSAFFRTGWNASVPCNCNSSAAFSLNCDRVAEHAT